MPAKTDKEQPRDIAPLSLRLNLARNGRLGPGKVALL